MTSTSGLDKHIGGCCAFDDPADFLGRLGIRHGYGIGVVRQIVPLDVEDIEEKLVGECGPTGFAIQGFDYTILQSLGLGEDK